MSRYQTPFDGHIITSKMIGQRVRWRHRFRIRSRVSSAHRWNTANPAVVVVIVVVVVAAVVVIGVVGVIVYQSCDLLSDHAVVVMLNTQSDVTSVILTITMHDDFSWRNEGRKECRKEGPVTGRWSLIVTRHVILSWREREAQTNTILLILSLIISLILLWK